MDKISYGIAMLVKTDIENVESWFAEAGKDGGHETFLTKVERYERVNGVRLNRTQLKHAAKGYFSRYSPVSIWVERRNT